jgi:hypothetical protein
MKWEGHITAIKETRNAYRILVGKMKDTDNLKNYA